MAMKLQQLRTFIAVCQERSFTAAARRINATQSGLSMQIKDLEDFLGVSLLIRNAGGVEPTSEGERFYQRAAAVLRDLNTAEEELRAINNELIGSIAVGVMPTFSRAVLPQVLNEFAETHPYVNIRIIEAYSTVLTKSVIRGEIDFAIVPPEPVRNGIRVEKVASDREVLVTKTDTDRENLTPISLDSAGPLKLVLPSAGNSRRTSLDIYMSTVGAQVEAVIELDGMMGTLDFVTHSEWVSIIPGALCYPDLSGTTRKIHPLTDPILSVDYVLIQPETKALSPAARAFSEFLIKRIQTVCNDIQDLFPS